ncbi:MAG: hypothetical protein O9264_16400, partial [Leptospira sp.]|nr:hypothetical protein [Leptospira sp.]
MVQIFNIRSAGCYPSSNQEIPEGKRPSIWGFYSLNAGNALVRDIVIQDTKAYVAGVFDYIAPNTGSLVMLNESDQTLLPELNCPYYEIDGSVNQIISDGSGNAIIVGVFSHVFGVKRKAVAKVKSDCTLDSTFNVNMADSTAEVRSALVHNGKLFIAGVFSGTFSTTGSETRSNLALVNLSTGALDTSWNTGANGDVNVIGSDGTSLYLGGSFGQVGGATVNNLAKVDLSTGTTISTLGEPDALVQA